MATVITQTAHSEFIEYLQVQASVRTNPSSFDNVEKVLQLAYLTKWSSFSLIALVLLLYVWRVGSQSRGSDDRAFDFLRDVDSPARTASSSGNRAGLEQSNNDQQHSTQQTAKSEAECGEVAQERDDEDKAFDFLRDRPRLRKRGEMILDRESSRD